MKIQIRNRLKIKLLKTRAAQNGKNEPDGLRRFP